MVELLIVRATASGHGMTGNDVESRFAAVKARVVGYVQVDVVTPMQPGACSAVIAPLGAVLTPDDADRLLKALEAEFPGQGFTVEVRRYEDATNVFCHSS